MYIYLNTYILTYVNIYIYIYTGTFHMWEQLNAPIIPLIFYGAYELYPVNNWVNNTG
jgi:1-acyl-sn-glycerol-3-phosphate acyltransferase